MCKSLTINWNYLSPGKSLRGNSALIVHSILDDVEVTPVAIFTANSNLWIREFDNFTFTLFHLDILYYIKNWVASKNTFTVSLQYFVKILNYFHKKNTEATNVKSRFPVKKIFVLLLDQCPVLVV